MLEERLNDISILFIENIIKLLLYEEENKVYAVKKCNE